MYEYFTIEDTIGCIMNEIKNNKEDIDNELLNEEEVVETEEYIKHLEDIKSTLGSIKDEYYLWLSEH